MRLNQDVPVEHADHSFSNQKTMAKVQGFFQLRGSIGDRTYYKSGGQYLVKSKPKADRQRIATDPEFKLVRENMAEFAKAGKAGKLIRMALSESLNGLADYKMCGRLTAALVKVIREDTLNPRGSRNVQDGNIGLLKGFSFNQCRSLFGVSYQAFIDRLSGKLTIKVDTKSIQAMRMPGNATHARFVATALEIDFEQAMFGCQNSPAQLIAINDKEIPSFELVSAASSNSIHPLFLVLRIEFLSRHGNTFLSVAGGSYNILQIVAASKMQV